MLIFYKGIQILYKWAFKHRLTIIHSNEEKESKKGYQSLRGALARVFLCRHSATAREFA